VDPFVAQLKDLCAAHPTRSKWVFVPTHAIGRTIGERIALEGTNWLNLRFVTPLDVALRMGAPFLVERGIDPSEEGLGPALMMRLLLDLPADGGYFRPLADQPTMAQALWTTIRELRMAGVTSADLRPDAFESSVKHAELRALLAAYEQFLTAHHRADLAVVYAEAVKHPDWCPIQPQDCWTELPDVIWTPLQRALIDSLPGERVRPKGLSIGVPTPRRLSAVSVERVAADVVTNPLAFLMQPGAAAAGVAGEQKVALFHAGGREAEIDEVFRRILALGVPLDQIEIACASDAHVELIWEKALRHDWPVTLGSGIPAVSTRPGRALIGLCDWIETDFSAGHFRRLLQSGDLGVEIDDEGFSAGQAARLIARAGAGWGRATYDLALGRLQKTYESRAADADASDDDRDDARKKADETAAIRRWLIGLVASVPVPGVDNKVPLQTVVNGVLEFLEHTTPRVSALDHRAATALHDYVAELRALGGFSSGLAESLRFIRERVHSLHVAPERPRPGHLFACTLAHSGFAGRPHVFIVGLEEGRVFSSSTEDAVLLDCERRGISPALRLSADCVDEAVYAVLGRLGTSGASATFSFSSRDTREFRETYASWLMLQAFRLQQGDPSKSYRNLKDALGDAKSAVPADRSTALSPGRWWLRSVVGTGDAGVAAVDAAFPDVAHGRSADSRRQSADFTEFDGYAPAAGPALDPCQPQRVYSVTELENAAGCLFRFFLKRGLGVRPVDERERDKDVWLDPLTRGSELHDLYAALLRRARDGNRRPDKNDAAWLMTRAEERLAALNEEMPAATTEILERESKEFLADVELFVDAEASNSSSTPIGFEVSFGRPLDDDNEEPLARSEPVEIDLGSGLKFRIAGRIDRIDQVGPSSFEIIDYKTGSFWRPDWQGTFAGGRRLQHALYGLAAVELLKTRFKNPKIERGVYYFSSRKGRQERLGISTPTRAVIAGVLGDLRDVIIRGQFVRTPNEKDCKYCDFATACGEGVNKQADAKLQDSRLDAYGKLAAHV
jgi:ATP-dependent helicase/nuclease subunit B